MSSLAIENPGDPDSALVVTPSGSIAMIDGSAAIRQRALMAISASPGATVFWPAYGAGVDLDIGSPTSTVRGSIAARIRRAILLDEDVRDVTVDVGPPEFGSEDRMSVRVVIVPVSGGAITIQAGV